MWADFLSHFQEEDGGAMYEADVGAEDGDQSNIQP